MASELHVDAIKHSGGTSALTIDSSGNVNMPGSVIQVVQTNFTASTTSVTGTTFTEITGLNVSITPKFATSKILWQCSIAQGENQDCFPAYKLFRDSTALNVPSAVGSGQAATFAGVRTGNDARDIYLFSQLSYQFLDSPNTTSQITYKVQVRPMGVASGRTVYINRSNTIGDANQFTATSTTTVMEIAQ